MDRVANELSFLTYIEGVLDKHRAAYRTHIAAEEKRLGETKKQYEACRTKAEGRNALMKLATMPSASKLKTETTRIEGLIRKLREKLEACPDVSGMSATYAEMVDVPRVKSITIENSWICIRTHVLFGKDGHNVWRRVGRYTISFDPRIPFDESERPIYKRFRWIRDGGAMPAEQGNAAMTSFGADLRGERTCLGTALPVLRQGLETFDLPTITKIIVRFPECPGQNNLLRHWPPARRDEIPEWYIRSFGE